MNSNILQSVRSKLEAWENLDLPAIVAKQYPDTDLDIVSIGEFTGTEFVSIAKRTLEQFQMEFDSPLGVHLPENYQFEHPISPANNQNYQLSAQLNAFVTQAAKNLNEASKILRSLIGYQLTNGFWDKSERKLHHPGRQRLQELVAELETRLGQIKERQASLKETTDDSVEAFMAHDAKLTEYSKDAESAATVIRDKLEKMAELLREKESEISVFVSKTSESKGQLEQMVEDQKERSSEMKQLLEKLEERTESIETRVKQSQKFLDIAKSDQQFIEGKREDIIKLVGLAAGGALGGRFETRRRSLSVASRCWLAGVVLASLAAAAWIWFTIVKVQPPPGINVWLALVWKIGILSPAIILIGFVARQYGRERALEEEYAFRSAMAMTLNSFADQISECKTDDPRLDLIKSTVEKLYQLPRSVGEKETPLPKGGAKTYKEIVDALTNALKEITSGTKNRPGS